MDVSAVAKQLYDMKAPSVKKIKDLLRPIQEECHRRQFKKLEDELDQHLRLSKPQPPVPPAHKFLSSSYRTDLAPIIEPTPGEGCTYIEKDQLGPYYDVKDNIRDKLANYKSLSKAELSLLKPNSTNLAALVQQASDPAREKFWKMVYPNSIYVATDR